MSKKNLVIADDTRDDSPRVSDNDASTIAAVVPRGTQSACDAVDQFASKIGNEWRKSAESILKVAQCCAEANQSLDNHDKKRLYEKLPFDRTMFSKLAGIGANKALFDDSIRKSLPASWTMLTLLRDSTEEELERAVSEGALYPGVTRSHLKKWLSEKGRRGKDDERRAKPNGAPHDEILEGLLRAFAPPQEWSDLWRKSPGAVRQQFTAHR